MSMWQTELGREAAATIMNAACRAGDVAFGVRALRAGLSMPDALIEMKRRLSIRRVAFASSLLDASIDWERSAAEFIDAGISPDDALCVLESRSRVVDPRWLQVQAFIYD